MSKYTFIDLFCGIGGIRLGFERANCECICSIEVDENAGRTYNENFGNYPLNCDIRWKSIDTIPDFDILCAGFPCQSFSCAGNQKGFEDTRGMLFFEIIRILKGKNPKAYFLENVSNLISHDKGSTFKIIQRSIEDLGYSFYYKIINSKLLVPQNRERIYMIGFKDRNIDFKFPNIPDLKPKLKDILETDVDNKFFYANDHFINKDFQNTNIENEESVFQYRRSYVRENKEGICPTLTANIGSGGNNVPIVYDENNKQKCDEEKQKCDENKDSKFDRYTLRDERWKYLQNNRKRIGKHGFGYEIPDLEGYSRTLMAIYNDEDILINQENKNPRKLTPRECARLQGFPDSFKIPVSDNHAYHQFGNSVTVPIIEYLAKEIVKTLDEKPKRTEPYSIQKNVFDY